MLCLKPLTTTFFLQLFVSLKGSVESWSSEKRENQNTKKREMVDHGQNCYRDEKCGNNRSW